MNDQEQLSMLEDRVKAAEALLEVMRELVKAKDQVIEALKAQPVINPIQSTLSGNLNGNTTEGKVGGDKWLNDLHR